MERDFYSEEFEELLREKTDQHKMYPSDKVWKGIYSALHTRRRRFIGGMSVLITGILLLAGKELLLPGTVASTSKKSPDYSASLKTKDVAPEPVFSELKIPTTSREIRNNPVNNISGNRADASVIGRQSIIIDPLDDASISLSAINQPSIINTPVVVTENSNAVVENFPVEDNDKVRHSVIRVSAQRPETMIKKILPADLVSRQTMEEKQDQQDKNDLNWLQQYASYELKNTVKKGRLNWQVYFSPTVNYRSLSGGDPYAMPKTGLQYVPIALTHFGSPDDYVNHKPAIGYEAGGSVLYRVTRSLTLKVGLQFNYSKYSIKAYTSPNSQQATIALNSLYGIPANTITGYTNIQNFGGYAQKDLINRYFQLSAPVGFELKILGNDKLQLNIAASIQPTYLLNRNAYLLTTDYSDYTKAPSLFRRWNFNAGVEAFISYKIGGLRWQIGPQLRYQLLSTYTDQYPIKENLKEYGIKIGVSKTIW